MTRLEAHELFARRTDRSVNPTLIWLDLPGGRADAWPAAMTAACVLSGMLDDCQTDADLDEAYRHFQTLVDIGVFDDQSAAAAIKAETAAVIGELMRTCAAMESAGGYAAVN